MYNDNVIIIKKTNGLKYVISCLCKIYDYNGKENRDRRNIHNFTKSSSFYKNQIYPIFDIHNFEPELEFCETTEQKSLWMYFRMTVSSHYPSKYMGFNTHILIRDKFTKKYVAITSLCEVRMGWTSNQNFKDVVRRNNIFNITTCIGIPPFSFNFNAGKLATMLMFSKEVYDYMKTKGKTVAGLMTYSLHGNSYQYSGLDNFELIGYTQGKGGKDNTRVPRFVYDNMIKIMRKKHLYIDANKNTNISYFCSKYGIVDATKHGIKHSIFYGNNGKNTMEYLNGNTGVFEPNDIPVEKIAKKWYVAYAIPRIHDLIKRNNIMVEYDYDTYYVDKSSYDRNRQHKKDLKIDRNRIERENEKRTMINYWLLNDTQAWDEIKINLEHLVGKQVNKSTFYHLINQNVYDDCDEKCITDIVNHKYERKQLLADYVTSQDIIKREREEKERDMNEKTAIIEREIRFVRNLCVEYLTLDVTKTRFFITSQQYNNLSCFKEMCQNNSMTKIENVMKGNWIINNKRTLDPSNIPVECIINMRHNNFDDLVANNKYIVRILHLVNDNIIPKIGVSQTNKDFHLNDLEVINVPYRVTGGKNIFADVRKSAITNKLNIILDEIYDVKHKMTHVVGITILSGIGCAESNYETCYCHDCLQDMLKCIEQVNIYDEEYLKVELEQMRSKIIDENEKYNAMIAQNEIADIIENYESDSDEYTFDDVYGIESIDDKNVNKCNSSNKFNNVKNQIVKISEKHKKIIPINNA
jgi:hypothetical protein